MSNFKNVLKVYTMMRAFDADDTALLNTLRGASEAEIELLVETVAPTKAKKKPTTNRARSPRAASLAGAIASKGRPLDGGVSKMRCAHVGDNGGSTVTCGDYVDSLIHDKTAGYAGYHPFQPPAAQAVAGGE